MFVNALYNSHACAVLVSEENEEPILVPSDIAGKYCVAFDPLDGSSNIDCNVSTGTIFSVWEKVMIKMMMIIYKDDDDDNDIDDTLCC